MTSDPIQAAIEASRERQTREWSIATEDAIVRDEARFREALAVAVEALSNAGCRRGAGCACTCRLCVALPRIAAILAGEKAP